MPAVLGEGSAGSTSARGRYARRHALRYFDFGAGVMPLFLEELANGAQIAGHPPEAA
jgi:hypothetical protein